ncbi:MAG: hypothetical protein KTR26_14265 [Flammeovirgaceae bacterium]|nr:hypothetical protein [Flammeovirgaceae bacterium]
MNLADEHKTRLLIALVVLAYTILVLEGLDTITAKYNNFKKFCRYF